MSSKQSQKGSRFEYIIRDKLIEATGEEWARAPSSGAGVIKGDLFAPKCMYYYCFECKSYKDSVIQENLLTAKSNNFYSWWKQTLDQADEMNKKPALVFKKDRGKPYVALLEPVEELNGLHVKTEWADAHIYLFDEWLKVVEDIV